MSVEHVPVVVIGAGPTGITVATLLAQYGIDCVILDRWAQVYPQPRAVHLDDEICRIVARLGLADGFAAISRPAHGLRLLDGSMNVLAEFNRDTALSGNGFPQANMFDQPEFETLLRANLERYPRARLRGGVEVTEVTDAKPDRVRVTYTDRSDGTEHRVDADYVLGCDGANSITRRRIGSRMHDLGFEQRWLVVDVATSADIDQWEGVHQVCDPQRAATYMRIGETRYRWEFQLLQSESAGDYATLDSLLPLFRPWVDQVPADDLTLVRVTEYTFRAQLADRWRRGRVFLLGDAAHLTPPFIGQGMGAGLRDAMNLAWKLAGVLDSALPEDVLDTYAQERKPHARTMIRLALGIGRCMTAGGELGSLTRRMVLPALQRLPGVTAKVLAGETPPLRRSALVRRARTPRRLAGRLCPNPVITGGHRLDAVLGGGFAVVTTSSPSPRERALIEQRGAIVHVTGTDSDLGRWLRRRRATAVLVRPDRAVMQAGRDLDRLCQRLPRYRDRSYSTGPGERLG
ncbi:bifunctional 3-(3-hydroxy-phenyl)propionate/3-hydroxycinnamic acid hydroxylase MhpA [Mycolicibacterium pyrenivorans]|uniref:bifunctional 3-(3-hydroxy-phenyl)propionate/3-hydroxycinnamic acid hydroxylase MhpA n=1 Tax=Mycolicibacterium pyrenivorans TaxID=187102 RepID=UPI0021F3C1C0|nr:bifunctional 3-(3-hydroxy-phenyl)propionate/3-hydroxycinnamic acid hydroxylase [Mycolicibacterium pyrenivorans]MCV7150279.1 bifunctional 3-(3-hydroxy-phenyl)propionate/3-hydroxycinnamic acid hydroxylase [Mycolicibacterium pyrenivorans]